LIHGFTGVPDDLRYLADRLNHAGYTVNCPRLPGHGTDGKDFVRVRYRDWLEAAAHAYLDLRSSHDLVYLGGLSMGGLIASVLASTVQPPGLMLFAPALKVTTRGLSLTPIVSLFAKSRYVGTDLESIEEPERVPLAERYYGRLWFGPASQLYRLQRSARSRLPRVSAPTFAVFSKADETVPIQTASYVKERIGSEAYRELILEDSGHVVVDGVQREKVATAATEWLSAAWENPPGSHHL
jgi:carboxylesterase